MHLQLMKSREKYSPMRAEKIAQMRRSVKFIGTSNRPIWNKHG